MVVLLEFDFAKRHVLLLIFLLSFVKIINAALLERRNDGDSSDRVSGATSPRILLQQLWLVYSLAMFCDTFQNLLADVVCRNLMIGRLAKVWRW